MKAITAMQASGRSLRASEKLPKSKHREGTYSTASLKLLTQNIQQTQLPADLAAGEADPGKNPPEHPPEGKGPQITQSH